ncbi:MAG: PIG-L family deacetylase [candidate division KSB1 bacterium]|nr:PIG-L family deacetylase [candidate division KSB1 bacterium]MDQ7065268.1 PIG-L family deacetylase [candidate division KSB1 bacterium]
MRTQSEYQASRWNPIGWLWPATLIIALILSSCQKPKIPPTFFPETGKAAFHQYALDLRNNFKVLYIALEPGFEDLPTLTYYRLGKGATVRVAFVSNGEAGEDDHRSEYPPYLAARRRNEAIAALNRIGGEAYFLNLPHLIAARDANHAVRHWPDSLLIGRLKKLMEDYKPDFVLVGQDRRTPDSPMWQVLHKAVLRAVEQVSPPPGARDRAVRAGWKIDRVFVEQSGDNGISAPVRDKHPIWKLWYDRMGQIAEEAYASLRRQRTEFALAHPRRYLQEYPDAAHQPPSLTPDIPKPPGKRLQWVYDEIVFITKQILQDNQETVWPHFVSVIDSINFKLAQRYRLDAWEIRSLLRWKIALENLRCAARGIRLDYTISDTCLTDRQLTYLTIHKIKGVNNANETVMFFGLDQTWAINEGFEKKFTLNLGERYRILTPGQLNYTVPQALYGMDDANPNVPLLFFVMQQGNRREDDFIYREKVNLTFTPKFVTEVLTPIVRRIPGAKLVLRMQNNSRDGVRDIVRVDHEYVASPGVPFRLSQKGAVVVDTLNLVWQKPMPEGSHRIPIRIQDFTVAHFAVRHFEANYDSSKRIGVVTALDVSPLTFALDNLRARYELLSPGGDFKAGLQSCDVVLVDHRVLSQLPALEERRHDLLAFAENGGHLIVLSQDARKWKRAPLLDGFTLSPSAEYDELYPVMFEAGHPLMNSPNPIGIDDWQGWLFQRAVHWLQLSAADGQYAVPVRGEDGTPFLLTRSLGKGRVTYVNLRLWPQFLNVHPGTYRLLANLLSL